MKLDKIKKVKNEKKEKSKKIGKEKENNINDKINKEIKEKIEEEKQLKMKQVNDNEELDSIIKLLIINRKERKKDDILRIRDYLCSHINFFKNFSEHSKEYLFRLISSLNYEFFETKERIINFGEEGDKCYVLLKGKVGIYKPFPVSKKMSFRDYVEYLVSVRDIEKNILKFERILNYNSKIDKSILLYIDFDYKRINQSNNLLDIILEEERELCQANSGNLFGEMSLIENEPRNATIIALENCTMISIEKHDYIKLVKEVEKQRINKELVSFKHNYPIFLNWPASKCIRLISGFITQEYEKDDYVYKQNDVPKNIYLIKEGKFEFTINFNFEWYEKFIEYIHDTSSSLLKDIDDPMLWKEDKITKKINNVFNNKTSPFTLYRHPIDKIIVSNKDISGENIDSEDDELYHDKNKIYRANIQKMESPNFFGFLEIFELKFRICNVKCISKKGVLVKYPLLEFLQLIPGDKKNQFYLQERIFKEKSNIILQLKNTILTKLNLIKKNKNNKIFLNKSFMINNNFKRYINELDFNTNYNENNLSPLRNAKISHNINSIQKINKSKSSIYYNISKNESNDNKKEIKSYKDDYIDKHYLNKYHNNKYNSLKIIKNNITKKGIILNFKNSILTLTKNKMKVFRGFFKNEICKKPSNISLDIKQIDNSDKGYIKYLKKNIQSLSISKNPSINDRNRMTEKKYINFEANKYIFKFNKNNKTRNTSESKSNSYLILPNINNSKNSLILSYDKDNNSGAEI